MYTYIYIHKASQPEGELTAGRSRGERAAHSSSDPSRCSSAVLEFRVQM